MTDASLSLAQCMSSQIYATLTKLEDQLNQLRQEQSILCESIDKISGNAELESQLASVKETMSKVSSYHTKVLSLRSTMAMLTARSAQLQRRADKLKTTKLEYLAQIDTIRRTEQARDQAIAARLAIQQPSSPSTPTTSLTPTSSSSATVTPVASRSRQSAVPSPAHSETVIAVAKKVKKKKPKAREVQITEEMPPDWNPKNKK